MSAIHRNIDSLPAKLRAHYQYMDDSESDTTGAYGTHEHTVLHQAIPVMRTTDGNNDTAGEYNTEEHAQSVGNTQGPSSIQHDSEVDTTCRVRRTGRNMDDAQNPTSVQDVQWSRQQEAIPLMSTTHNMVSPSAKLWVNNYQYRTTRKSMPVMRTTHRNMDSSVAKLMVTRRYRITRKVTPPMMMSRTQKEHGRSSCEANGQSPVQDDSKGVPSHRPNTQELKNTQERGRSSCENGWPITSAG